MRRDRFRAWVARNVQLAVFLASYTLTVVLGNFLYATPIGRDALSVAGLPTELFSFPTAFSPGFWLLLLLPYGVAPAVAIWTRRALARSACHVSQFLPEFRMSHFALLAGACYGFILISFWRSGAVHFIGTGTDFISSVKARYAIRAALGPKPLIVLQAVLPFLAYYSVVRALQSGSYRWLVGAAVNVIVTATLLIGLNMKWPPLLFLAGVVLIIFLYAPRAPYTMTVLGMVVLAITYFAIAGFVLRVAPPATEKIRQWEAYDRVHLASRTMTAASKPLVWVLPVHRMALSYPYYYDIFTREGHVCGGIAEILRHRICHPSFLVYARTFRNDIFEGAGTSPAAVHISGYAFGGWPVAILAMVLASVVMGGFAALPIDRNATVGALATVGAIAGYHFSQIPGEGVFLNEQGLVWVGFLVLGHIMFRVVTGSTIRTLPRQIFSETHKKRLWP